MTDLPENYDELPSRQQGAIDVAVQNQQLPEGAAFQQDFKILTKAVAFLAKLAQQSSGEIATEAAALLAEWRSFLATPEDIARIYTDDEHEVMTGALIADTRGEDGRGYWISSWIWADHDPNEKPPTPEELARMKAEHERFRREWEIDHLRHLADKYPEILRELQASVK